MAVARKKLVVLAIAALVGLLPMGLWASTGDHAATHCYAADHERPIARQLYGGCHNQPVL